jgi:hypothetical protein
MITRSVFALASLSLAGLLGAFVGCSSDPDPTPATEVDSGTVDTGTADVAIDTGSEAATDSGSDACTASAPPKGFTVVDEYKGPSDTADRGDYSTMALDDDGSPMIAYAIRGTDSVQVMFTRWDRSCGGRWTTPVEVATPTDLASSSRGLSLAYDKTTKEVGIAYRAQVGKLTGTHHYELRFASMFLGGSEMFVDKLVASFDPETSVVPGNVSLAMGAGKAFILAATPYVMCGTSGCDAILLTERTTSTGDAGAGDGGADTGSADAGTGGSTVPETSSGWSSFAKLPAGHDVDHSISAAVDSAGQLGFVWAQDDDTGPSSTIWFQRATGAPVSIMTGVGTEFANGALAFDGTKPRVAMYMHKTDWATTGDNLWFSASNDGTSFSTPIVIPKDKGEEYGHYVAIAVGGGKVVVGANIGAAAGDTMPSFGNPKYATSTDLTTFTVTGPKRTEFVGNTNWLQIAIGAGGELQFAFSQPTPGALVKPGLVYYRAE